MAEEMVMMFSWTDEGHLATAEGLKLLSQPLLARARALSDLGSITLLPLSQPISEEGLTLLRASLRHDYRQREEVSRFQFSGTDQT